MLFLSYGNKCEYRINILCLFFFAHFLFLTISIANIVEFTPIAAGYTAFPNRI